jgi:integration host factor subunit alpha
MTITRAHLIESISRQAELPRGQCSQLLESLLKIIMKTLESGEDVLITGFGKFWVKEKKERKGRNPATGQDLTLRPRRVVTFQHSPVLKGKLNKIRRRKR